jgi:hypothetical protein
MSKIENTPVVSDSHIVSDAGVANAAPSAAHNEVFNSPHDYLESLRQNFGAISHGQTGITLNDLQIAESDTTLSPSAREAAKVTADHFQDFNNTVGGKGNPDDSITMKDVGRVEGLVDHKMPYAVSDIIMSAGLGGGVGGSLLTGITGAMTVDALSSGYIGFGLFFGGGALVAAGATAYMGYQAYEAYQGYKQDSSRVTANVNSWLNASTNVSK